MAKYQINDFAWNGKYHDYCWNRDYNPNATISNCLANCTTLAVAFSYILGTPYPVSTIRSASAWHNYLTNGWTYKNYDGDVKVGDIIQWVSHCHVATVIGFQDGEPLLACSWYTGEHGKSSWGGGYDPRDQFHTLQEVSDFMVNNYPYRFYHEATLAKEAEGSGGMPEHILVAPVTITPVKRDKSRNQIKVLTNEQNVRDHDLNIVGIAPSGYYNVIGSFVDDYTWYEVEVDRFIAGVNGRVEYLEAEGGEIEKLRKENAELKAAMNEVFEIIKRWL